MNEDFIGTVGALLMVGALCWMLGWHYGAKSLRNRHAKLTKVIEQYSADANKRDKRTGNNWYDGYQKGIADTLSTLERFLDKFKE